MEVNGGIEVFLKFFLALACSRPGPNLAVVASQQVNQQMKELSLIFFRKKEEYHVCIVRYPGRRWSTPRPRACAVVAQCPLRENTQKANRQALLCRFRFFVQSFTIIIFSLFFLRESYFAQGTMTWIFTGYNSTVVQCEGFNQLCS